MFDYHFAIMPPTRRHTAIPYIIHYIHCILHIIYSKMYTLHSALYLHSILFTISHTMIPEVSWGLPSQLAARRLGSS